MIGADEINAALDKINPQHDAVQTIANAFGNAEALPLVEDVMASLQIDTDAVRDFAAQQLRYYLEDEGDPLELAVHKANAMILGFTAGVAAAREAQDV